MDTAMADNAEKDKGKLLAMAGIDAVIVLLFCMEQTLRVTAASSVRIYWHCSGPADRFDLLVVALSALCYVAYIADCLYTAESFGLCQQHGIWAPHQSFQVAMLDRLHNHRVADALRVCAHLAGNDVLMPHIIRITLLLRILRLARLFELAGSRYRCKSACILPVSLDPKPRASKPWTQNTQT